MTMQQPSFRGVYVFAEDLARSIEFYTLLGLDMEKIGNSFARANWGGQHFIELGTAELTRSYDPDWETPGDPAKNTIGLEFAADEQVDEICAKLEIAGFSVKLNPCTPPWNARFAIVIDPDGNFIGLHGPRDLSAEKSRE